MNIKISIIIPVYNVAPYLDACLSSCVNQTFRDIEIVVVNDGSSDESPRIIAAYAEKDNRIVVVTKKNQGLVYARKSGLDVARGEYVFHLDGDDYIELNSLEELYNNALKYGADYVIGYFYNVCDKSKYKVKIGDKLNGLSGQNLLLNMLYGGWSLCGRLIHKSLFNNLVYYPVFMGEDLFFNMQVTPRVKNAIVVDMCLYNYVNHSHSITNQKKNEMFWKQNAAMLESVFYLLDIYPYNRQIRDRIHLMFLTFILSCISYERKEINTILYDNYWSKKEVMELLWKKRKDYYLIINTFFRSPSTAHMMAKIYMQMHSIWRKCGLFVFRYKNWIKS